MPTVAEVYNPLIESRNNQVLFDTRLREVGQLIFENNPTLCKSLEDGIRQAKVNLNYYCQYFDDTIASQTKKAMGEDNSWVSLFGQRVPNSYK